MIFILLDRIRLWLESGGAAMDLRQLRYFVKVVECGNVTHASEALHVAQPAVSQQMRNLEQDLGMQLLERSVRGVAPTAAGRTLYQHALELLRQADGTRELLRRDADTPQGRVTVGMPSSTARVLAIPLARAVRDRYPGIMLERSRRRAPISTRCSNARGSISRSSSTRSARAASRSTGC